MQKEIKKTSIGEIGKEKSKVTIADEIEVATQYHLEPNLSPKELIACWLDPSEFDLANKGLRWKMVVPHSKNYITITAKEVLEKWLPKEAYHEISFIQQRAFSWASIKSKVLRKFNLTDLIFNSLADKVQSIQIKSKQPLYDQDAHSNRVRNILRAVKLKYPHVVFEHESCLSSGTCPIGLQQALRKLAEETHGK